MDIQDDMNDNVVDFIEYRLMRELDSIPVGTLDWEAMVSVLDMYLSGFINVVWTKDDVMIKMKDGVDMDQVYKMFPKNETTKDK